MVKCPICQLDIENSQNCLVHVWIMHTTRIDASRRQCWCGAYHRLLSEFESHVEARGSVFAHYMACYLGVFDG
jgi:hypothetical protein